MNENEILIALKGEIYPIFSLSLAREENIYHELKEFNNKMYVLTNKNAPNNKVSLLEKNVLNDIVKMKENTQIIDFLFTDNFMVIKTLKNSFIELVGESSKTAVEFFITDLRLLYITSFIK